MSEDFLRRWSRLKRETNAPAPASGVETPPALPPLESLTFESDFKAFMHSKVEEGVKRAALKKLFADPRFNVMDGLDTYIDDYTKAEPISEELLAQIEHARRALVLPKPEEAGQELQVESPQEKKEAQENEEAQGKKDVDPA